MTLPNGAQKIPDLWTFKKRVGPISHIAVYRPSLEIYHHFLVKEVHVHSMVIIHNVEGLSKSIASSGFDRIKEDEIEFTTEQPYRNQFESDHLDFKSGVYLIERHGYPITKDEKEKVIERATKRLVEKDFSFSSSNSELFVTWAMTGVGECAAERAVSKKMAESVGTVSGSFWGAVIGHILIPVPVVGGIVGGMVGGVIGRTTGALYNRQDEELRKRARTNTSGAEKYNGQEEPL